MYFKNIEIIYKSWNIQNINPKKKKITPLSDIRLLKIIIDVT